MSSNPSGNSSNDMESSSSSSSEEDDKNDNSSSSSNSSNSSSSAEEAEAEDKKSKEQYSNNTTKAPNNVTDNDEDRSGSYHRSEQQQDEGENDDDNDTATESNETMPNKEVKRPPPQTNKNNNDNNDNVDPGHPLLSPSTLDHKHHNIDKNLLWQKAQAGDALTRREALWLTLETLKTQIEYGDEVQSALHLKANQLQEQLDAIMTPERHHHWSFVWDTVARHVLWWGSRSRVAAARTKQPQQTSTKRHYAVDETDVLLDLHNMDNDEAQYDAEEIALWKTLFRLRSTMEYMEEERVVLEQKISHLQEQVWELPPHHAATDLRQKRVVSKKNPPPPNDGPNDNDDHDDNDQSNSHQQHHEQHEEKSVSAITLAQQEEDDDELDQLLRDIPPNNNKNNDDDNDHDLDQMLNDLDIDGADFNVVDDIDLNTEETWDHRLYERPAVFSKRYRPSSEEQRELERLEQAWGLDRTSIPEEGGDGSTGGGASNTTWISSLWGAVPSSEQNNNDCHKDSRVVWKRLVEAPSLLLKRGYVVLLADHPGGRSKKKKDTDSNSSDNGSKDGSHSKKGAAAELVLLTHGFAIATRGGGDYHSSHDSLLSSSSSSSFTLHCAVEWKNVAYVTPVSSSYSSTERSAWQIQLSQGDKDELQPPITVRATSSRNYTAWMNAMERVLIQYHLHHHHNNNGNNSKDLGWEYKLVHKPAFTMAVTGNQDHLPVDEQLLNELDSYNGYAPLHYAIRLKNEAIVRHFLTNESADASLPDHEGLTPAYHAVHDEAPESILEALRQFGAGPAVEQALAQKADLTVRVKASQQRREQRIQAEQAENLRLMQERQEKIDQAAERSRALNENAANYADLARQIKEKTTNRPPPSWGSGVGSWFSSSSSKNKTVSNNNATTKNENYTTKIFNLE